MGRKRAKELWDAYGPKEFWSQMGQKYHEPTMGRKKEQTEITPEDPRAGNGPNPHRLLIGRMDPGS